MNNTVMLAAHLPATPSRVYQTYLEAETHSAFTGLPVTIEPRPGTPFLAFDGMLSGTLLHIEPSRLIVQTWRSGNWPAEAVDSVLTLTLFPEGDGTRVELVQVNVPDEDFAGVCEGWEKYYWTPWRDYLRQ
jgi:activator of HSP90 ATPase